MTLCPQEISLQYGAFTINNTNRANYIVLDNAWSLNFGENAATLNLKILVLGSDNADFIAKQNALIEAFRDIRQSVILSHNGNTIRQFDATGHTDSDSRPAIDWLEDDHFTDKSSTCQVRVQVTLPAITSRIDESISISEDPQGIRTITCSATYRATSSSSSYAAMNADFSTFLTTCKNFVDSGATWEHVSVPSANVNPITDNTTTKTQILHELIYNQSSAGLDDTKLVEFNLTEGLTINWTGDTVLGQAESFLLKRNPKRLLDVSVSFETGVKKADKDLVGIYNNTIRPYILEQAKGRFGLQSVAVLSQTASYNKTRNVLSGSLTIQGATEGIGQVISSTITITERNTSGVLIKLAQDGTPFGGYLIPVKASRVRTITESVIFIGAGISGSDGGDALSAGTSGRSINIGIGSNSLGGLFGRDGGGNVGIFNEPRRLNFSSPGGGSSGGQGNVGVQGGGEGQSEFIVMTTEDETTPKKIGNISVAGENLPVCDKRFTVVQQYYEPFKRGGLISSRELIL